MVVYFKAIYNVALLNLALKSSIEVFATAVAGNKAHQWKLSLVVFGQELTLNLNCIWQSLARRVSRELFMSRPLLLSETLPDLRARPQAPEQTQVDGIGMSDRPPASSFFIPPDWQTKRPCQRDLAFVELNCFTSFALWEMLGVAVAVTIFLYYYFGRGWPSVVFLIGFQLGLNIPPQSHQTWRISSQNQPVCDTVSFFVSETELGCGLKWQLWVCHTDAGYSLFMSQLYARCQCTSCQNALYRVYIVARLNTKWIASHADSGRNCRNSGCEYKRCVFYVGFVT